jgi:glycosyltransferase involved in cell wall biosynthesis
MRLRICHLITDLDTGGAERSLVNLLTRMDKVEFDNDVVSLLEPGPMAEPLAAAGIPVRGLGMRRGRPSPAALAGFISHLRRTRPMVLQTWLYHADLLGTVASLFARPPRLLWNVRCTTMTVGDHEPHLRWVVRLLATLSKRPDAIVVNSRRGQSDHEAAGYVPKRWVDLPNGVDVERFVPRPGERPALRRRLGLAPDAPTIGFVGRDHPMKDVRTFLHGASLLHGERSDVRFVLCGDGFDAANDRLARTISNLGLGQSVTLLGRRSDMEMIYPAFDILTLCSIYGEGFPNVLVEAMACGVPCVATDTGDSAEIVGDCGMIMPMRDPQGLAASWRTLLDRSADEIGKRARERTVAHYSIARMCTRYEDLYRSLGVSVAPSPV